MNEWLSWLRVLEPLSVLVGVLLGLLPVVGLWMRARQLRLQGRQQDERVRRLEVEQAKLQHERDDLRQALAVAQAGAEQLQEHGRQQQQVLEQRLTALQQRLDGLQQEHEALLQQHAALEARHQSEIRAWEDKLARLEQMREQMKQEFAELSRQTLERESRQFARQSEQQLKQLLDPMQRRLQDFQQLVQQGREQDMKDRSRLQEHIRLLTEQNQRISDEARALTRALTSQAKTRGNWGERQIERALELSGLQEGREYQREVTLRDDRGRRWRPDVLVHLPEGRSLIIDAKLSLNHYIDYVNAEDEAERAAALKAHVQALKQHVRELADKRYDKLEGVKSLDFVLMFVPNESAFIEAVNQEPTLYDDAFRQHVVIVTTSTLLASLQTVASLWRYEKQQRNAQEIAAHAARLYDKFAGFVDDMEKVGQRLRQARESYDGAMNKLRDGRGNLMRQMERFVELGAQPKKRLMLEDAPEAGESAPADADPERR